MRHMAVARSAKETSHAGLYDPVASLTTPVMGAPIPPKTAAIGMANPRMLPILSPP